MTQSMQCDPLYSVSDSFNALQKENGQTLKMFTGMQQCFCDLDHIPHIELQGTWQKMLHY